MNYRHDFHAGNFADLLKHAVLTEFLAAAMAKPGPLTIIDTHAGAGLYDLAGEASRRTAEGEAAVTLMRADNPPPAFAALRAAIARVNLGELRHYPGSPEIIAAALRPKDRFIACEARQAVFNRLKANLRGRPTAQAISGDGWSLVRRYAPPSPAKCLVLIDPPYESGDDSAQAAAATRDILARNPAAIVALWAPIKDLASFDALLSEIELGARGRSICLAQTRLRPLDDPTRLNGCAMIVVNPPSGLAAPAGEAAAWLAQTLGEAGAFGAAEIIAA